MKRKSGLTIPQNKTDFYETKKLFYNKYLYKLEFVNSLGHLFRGLKLNHAKKKLNELQRKADNKEVLCVNLTLTKRTIGLTTLRDAQQLYSFLSNHRDAMIRVDHPTMSIYFNNEHALLDLSKKLHSDKKFWKPCRENIDVLLNETNVILVNQESNFKYRVTLGKQKDKSFVKWVEKNSDKVRAGPVFLREAGSEDRDVDGMYIYVRDDKILQLVTLLGVNIRRVDKLVCNSNLDK